MRRVKGFRKPAGSVLCTRPGPLGNQFFITGPNGEGENRQAAVDAFERWARAVLKNRVPINDTERKFLKAFDAAKTATKLLCYCRLDQACHVDRIRLLIQEGY